MKGTWIICVQSYEIDGVCYPKGRMEYSYAQFRQACSPNWRRATDDEIATKQWHNGNYFNLKNV